LVFRGKDPGEKNIRDMNKSIQYRGPDASGFEHISVGETQIYLGANRLRIVDQSPDSDQPFSKDGHVLLFNGEIYNHQELKSQLLDRGIHFSTSSDTEVLFHWLSVYGIDGLNQLQGMFAIVFYSKHNQNIIVARDCHGMKPLYFYNENGLLIISSEIRGILASGMINKELNENQVNYYLNYKYARSPETFFKEVQVLNPGEYFKYSIVDSNHLLKSYVRPDIEESTTVNDNEIIDKIEELLINALTRQTSASVPVGLLLSGGIDSTLLLAINKKHKIADINTYSIVNSPGEKQFGTEDYHYSKRAATLYGNTHKEISIDYKILEGFNDFISELDQPVADNGAWLTWLISKHARESSGVLLSGAGADEYFGGYNRHAAFYQYLRNSRTVKSLLPFTGFLGRLLPTGHAIPGRKKFQLIKKLLSGLDKTPELTYDRFLRMFNGQVNFEYQEIWPEYSAIDFLEKNMLNALYRDRKEYLVSDVLEISDRMSMKQSMEMRLPYLDDQLTGFLKMLPVHQIMKNGQKWILKELLRRYDGTEFLHRSKEGFGMPFGHWIRFKQYQGMINEHTAKERFIFNWINRDVIMKTYNNHLNKKADYTLEIWAFMVLSAWLENEFS